MADSKASAARAAGEKQQQKPPAKPAATEANGSGESREPKVSKVRTLADILKAGDGSDTNDDDTGSGESGSGTTNDDSAGERRTQGKAGESHDKPPKTLKDVAERLGLAPEALYKVTFVTGSGKAVTLGEMKDAIEKQGDFAVRELAFEERRTREESELLRGQQELRELLGALPQNAVKPEVLEAVRKRHAQRVATERRLTLEVIPEWADEAVQAKELEGMAEHLKGYGFPASYLTSVYSHTSLKYIRENWLREKRLRAALELAEREAPETPGRARGNNGKPPARPRDEQTPRGPRDGDTQRSRLMAILNKGQ